jgi:hypothetical protein
VSARTAKRPDGRPFCAAESIAREEPLAATASRIDHWLLVEYRGAWARDILGESLLSAELKEHLRDQLAALGRARLLFVKQPERRSQDGRRVFFGSSRPGEERLFTVEVEHQQDLRGFDFVAALAGDGGVARRVDEPLLVVCTHGKRDRCCARFGRPLYDALRDEGAAENVWQSSHVGGDRFAGNVVVLPHGLYYGRVGPAGVSGLAAATRAGRIDLDHYRGRSAYSFPMQAAEQALREREGLTDIGDLALVGAERRGDDAWRVRFRAPDSSVHELDVVGAAPDEAVYLTCTSAEPQRARHHVVTAHRVVARAAT